MRPQVNGDPMLPRSARVRCVTQEAHGIATLELEPADAPAGEPGQFNMLYAFGVGEVAISISEIGDAATGAAHTVRAAGAVTRALAALEPGMPLGVRGPFGKPWPLAACAGRDVLIVAGGIGLAPLRSAIAAIRHERARYGRVAVIVGGRSPEHLIHAADLAAWRADSTLQVETVVDHAGADWRHDVGVVTDLLPRAQVDAKRTTALLCGPEAMMRLVANALGDRGVPADSIFLSLERNMKCAIGHCGHCQLGPDFICKDGPVLSWHRVAGLLRDGEM